MLHDVHGNEIDESTVDLTKGRIEDIPDSQGNIVRCYIPYKPEELAYLEERKRATDIKSILVDLENRLALAELNATNAVTAYEKGVNDA